MAALLISVGFLTGLPWRIQHTAINQLKGCLHELGIGGSCLKS
jgi:hypothetical protein